MFFAYTQAQEPGGQAGTAGVRPGQARRGSGTSLSLLKRNRKVSPCQAAAAAFPAQGHHPVNPTLPVLSSRQAPAHPALPGSRLDAAAGGSQRAPMGALVPKGRCCVNPYFIKTVNCDKRAIKILVLLQLFLHLEQLCYQEMLHIALYTQLAALSDNITALLNNRYKNHRSLETTN